MKFDFLNKNSILEKQFQYFTSPDDSRRRQFYMLPEIHKSLKKNRLFFIVWVNIIS